MRLDNCSLRAFQGFFKDLQFELVSHSKLTVQGILSPYTRSLARCETQMRNTLFTPIQLLRSKEHQQTEFTQNKKNWYTLLPVSFNGARYLIILGLTVYCILYRQKFGHQISNNILMEYLTSQYTTRYF